MLSIGTLIVARDAADTLADAIRSALEEPIDELVLVDDVSGDGTGDLARSFADPRVRVVELSEHRTLGYARGVGLAELRSDLCFLLDADDMFMSGRIGRLSTVFEDLEIGFVADEIELVDGESGESIRSLSIPRFLDDAPGLMRLFERNYLPGIGQIGFRVDAMRRIGYDPMVHGTEDTDLVLRALASGARGCLVRELGYRMRHFSGSVSRDRERQSEELAKVLRKFSVEQVSGLLLGAGATHRQCLWSVLSFALFCGDYAAAGSTVVLLEDSIDDFEEILEPDGPQPVSERWRLLFAKGTLALLDGEEGGERFFEHALEIERFPEVLNNLGVAYLRMGKCDRAMECFEEAVSLNGRYVDARENLDTQGRLGRVTVHPLRREPSRSEY